MKESTERKLRKAFKAGVEKGIHIGERSYFDSPLNENEYIESLRKEKKIEETIPVTYATIKEKCGWSEFCDVTGGNHYAVKDFGIEDREIFDVKKSHAKVLGLI